MSSNTSPLGIRAHKAEGKGALALGKGRFGVSIGRKTNGKGRRFEGQHEGHGKSVEPRRSSMPSFKKVTCKFWEKGLCRNGEECRFLHGKAPEPGPLSDETVIDIMQFLEENGGQLEGGQIAAKHIGIKKIQLQAHFDVVDAGLGKFWVRLPGFDGPLPTEVPKVHRERVIDADSLEEVIRGNYEDGSSIFSQEDLPPDEFGEVIPEDPLENFDEFGDEVHSQNANDVPSNIRSSWRVPSRRPCLFFARGICKNGGSCPFVHDSVELEVPMLDEVTFSHIARFLELHGGSVEGGMLAKEFKGVKRAQLESHFNVISAEQGVFTVSLL